MEIRCCVSLLLLVLCSLVANTEADAKEVAKAAAEKLIGGAKGAGGGGDGAPGYGAVVDKVGEHLAKASERAREIQDEHMKNVEKDPGSLITKEAMKKIMASSSFLPQKAGTHSISVEPGQGFNGISNYQPAGWKITESMSGSATKKEETSNEKEAVATYPYGLGPVLLNHCTERNYSKSSPCYNSKLFDLKNAICLNLMDAAGYIGVGFDGRGYYSPDSRKASVIQRVCANKATFLNQDVPDIMNVFGIFHTVAETKSFQSVDQYMRFIRHKAGLSNQKGLFTSEASKYGRASSFGFNLGGVGALAGAGIGAAAGGPGGAMLGAAIGGALGSTMEGGAGSGKGKSKSTDKGESSSKIEQTDKSNGNQRAEQNFFAMMYVNVILYELTMDEIKPSDLSLTMLKDYMELPASYYSIGADVSYQNFLQRWGTHFIRSGKFGGQLKVTKTMKTNKAMTSDQFSQVAESEFKSMFATLQSSYKQKSSGGSFLGIGGKSKSTKQKAKAKSESKYESKLNAKASKSETFRQSEFTQTSVEAQGGTPEIAEALMDFYTPSFKQLFHDWIASIKDYAKPFEFQLRASHDLFNMRMKDLFPAGDVDFGCKKGGKSKVKIMVEAKTNKRFYVDTRITFDGKKSVEEKIKVYCRYHSSEGFKKDFDRRRISLERAIGIYMVEGPFPTASYELRAGQVGCEEKTLTKFHLFANSTKVMKFAEMQSSPFLLVLDLPQPISGISSAQAKFQVMKRGRTWYATKPGAPDAHLYDGCELAGQLSKKPKICFRNIILTYEESSGIFRVDPLDFKLSQHRMPSLPNWLSGTPVGRPVRIHSVQDIKRGVLNNEVSLPCNVRWLNSHRLDPTKKENCLHFTAATEGEIFVVFASIPRDHSTWRYVQINPQGVAFYRGYRLENRIQKGGMGVLGDKNLYQSYFVCVVQDDSSVLIQYGKADPDSEVGTVYASYKYAAASSFSRMSFYAFGSGEKPVSLMDIRLTRQMPSVKCLDKDYIKKDAVCVLDCHDECNGCKRARDSKACQQCKNVRVNHGQVVECLSVCPAGKTLSKSTKGLCVDCPGGTFKGAAGNQACSKCAKGAFSQGGASKCTPCTAGTFNDKLGQASCQKCSAGSFSGSTGATKCSPCGLGKFSSAGRPACDPCPYGHYGNQKALAKCKPCSRGHFAGSRGLQSCSKCPVGTSSAAASRSCGNSCIKGQYSPKKGVPCRKCPAGSFSESAGSDSCSKCPAGSYQNSIGQSTCIRAPKGSFAAGPGATTFSKCPAGRFNDKDGQSSSSACRPCPAGSYAKAQGSISCTRCPAGTFQSRTGQSSCTKAAAGHYVSEAGKAAQVPCPYGAAAAAAGSTKCTACPKGHFAASAGSRVCAKCPGGKYASQTGLRACRTCGIGFYAPAGASKCSRCSAGWYGPSAGLAACKTCHPGTFASGVGSRSCSKCPAGSYAPSHASSSCRKCPAGSYAPSLASSSCKKCSRGMYAGSTGSRSCTRCSGRYYTDGIGKTSCTHCSGMVSPTNTGCHNRRVRATLGVSSRTHWGSWGGWSWCPVGYFVNRFQLRVERSQGRGDDTALNTIRMYCSNNGRVSQGHRIESRTGYWGDWQGVRWCHGFYNAINFRSERSQGRGDDTAGNDVTLRCSDSRWHYGGGKGWGNWVGAKYCPGGSAICALRTQVEGRQGKGDDTALNNFQVKCCQLPSFG